MNEPVDSSVAVRIMVKEGKRSVFTIDLASDHVHSRLVSGAIWMASALNAEIIKLARQWIDTKIVCSAHMHRRRPIKLAPTRIWCFIYIYSANRLDWTVMSVSDHRSIITQIIFWQIADNTCNAGTAVCARQLGISWASKLWPAPSVNLHLQSAYSGLHFTRFNLEFSTKGAGYKQARVPNRVR